MKVCGQTTVLDMDSNLFRLLALRSFQLHSVLRTSSGPRPFNPGMLLSKPSYSFCFMVMLTMTGTFPPKLL